MVTFAAFVPATSYSEPMRAFFTMRFEIGNNQNNW